MILQALYDYYQRKADDNNSCVAPEGFEWKEIPFVIVIDRDGNLVSLQDTREGDAKKKTGKRYLLPKSVGRSGSNSWQTSFLLWDHYGYVVGHPKSDSDKDQAMAQKQFSSFIQKLQSLPSELKNDDGVLGVLRFYEKNGYEKVKSIENWGDCAKIVGCNMSFRLDGDSELIPCRDAVQSYVKSQTGENSGGVTGLCLVTGKMGAIARTHTDTPINKDSKKFVSFQKNSGYDSYGKQQGFNAPISQSAEFAYTTALNILLGKNSKNKVQVGDATAVFWAQHKNDFEEIFPAFFGYPKDDPDADVKAVKALYEGILSGQANTDTETRFYVLGLAPNSARIAVRFWHTGRIGDFSINIRQHFDDHQIIRSQNDSRHYSMFWILSSMAHDSKIDNVPPNLSAQIFQSVITGGLYPITMLQQTIRRIRATQAKDLKRYSIQASILKAYLNRFSRIYNKKSQEIQVALDPTNHNSGYCLGRLFAVLERIQEKASSSSLNTTIRDRFYGAASSTPVTVYPQLLKLKNHHLSKIDERSKRYYERLVGEIIDGLGEGMPSHLAMEDQARFAIGYYHQRQDFFKKKDSENKNDSEGE
ncbi:type I-C CRISPR-associated protein Cas8c/Csd1 [Prosthecochloris sp. HL-130-GSB]|uniref:type I-C CRISPR-associated protein Cas8c/Csd1 n=1 Tax=Prosthecochloris sp. HL-130-GSB TaxID=1974213 RepID=UPI000A1C0237|nr:type I-C CRISPR-associated protein Cas8c/Csd1 [Prosthecochloris sp. HL-130-GSB]ARM31062.1 type I-C CRISPR-associated protein Cas8c/Csd1 [Prosthecochloris sp. HL-130-GSB]